MDRCSCNKWYNYKNVIDLDKVPSLQRKLTNQFGDLVYPKSGVFMSSFDAWLMMYGKYIFASFFDNTNLELPRQGRISFKDMAEVLRLHGVVRLATRF